MSMRYLGPSFDIHTGGIDLVFPHHEDEIAQSEAATGQPLRAHLAALRPPPDGRREDGQAHRQHRAARPSSTRTGTRPRALRYALLAAHYRAPLDFSDASLAAAAAAVERLSTVLAALRRLPRGPGRRRRRWRRCSTATRAAFAAALDDDLNVSPALAAVFDLVRELNRRIAERTLSTADAAGRGRAAARPRPGPRRHRRGRGDAADRARRRSSTHARPHERRATGLVPTRCARSWRSLGISSRTRRTASAGVGWEAPMPRRDDERGPRPGDDRASRPPARGPGPGGPDRGVRRGRRPAVAAAPAATASADRRVIGPGPPDRTVPRARPGRGRPIAVAVPARAAPAAAGRPGGPATRPARDPAARRRRVADPAPASRRPTVAAPGRRGPERPPHRDRPGRATAAAPRPRRPRGPRPVHARRPGPSDDRGPAPGPRPAARPGPGATRPGRGARPPRRVRPAAVRGAAPRGPAPMRPSARPAVRSRPGRGRGGARRRPAARGGGVRGASPGPPAAGRARPPRTPWSSWSCTPRRCASRSWRSRAARSPRSPASTATRASRSSWSPAAGRPSTRSWRGPASAASRRSCWCSTRSRIPRTWARCCAAPRPAASTACSSRPAASAPISPAAIKASAGAVEHLLLVPLDDLAGGLADLHGRGLRLVGADECASLAYREADLRGPLALVVGSEGQGISGPVRRRLDLAVRIPMRGSRLAQRRGGGLGAAVRGRRAAPAGRQRRRSGRSGSEARTGALADDRAAPTRGRRRRARR